MSLSITFLKKFSLWPAIFIAVFAIESIAGQGVDLGVVRLDHREYNAGTWRGEAGQTAHRKRLDIGVARLDADEYRLVGDTAAPTVTAQARPTADCGVVRIDLEDFLDLKSRIRETMDAQRIDMNKEAFLAAGVLDTAKQP